MAETHIIVKNGRFAQRATRFARQESWLLDGKIPANTICPFRAICSMTDKCNHAGYRHNVAYSCGSARAYDLTSTKGRDHKVCQHPDPIPEPKKTKEPSHDSSFEQFKSFSCR